MFLAHFRKDPQFHARLSKKGAYNAIVTIFDAAGIDTPSQKSTHILKHTAIDQWIDAGVPTKKIINMTDHANEIGLEPYFRRRKELTKELTNEFNPLAIQDSKTRSQEFERLLVRRYVGHESE